MKFKFSLSLKLALEGQVKLGFKDFFKKKVEIFVTDKKLKAYQKRLNLIQTMMSHGIT